MAGMGLKQSPGCGASFHPRAIGPPLWYTPHCHKPTFLLTNLTPLIRDASRISGALILTFFNPKIRYPKIRYPRNRYPRILNPDSDNFLSTGFHPVQVCLLRRKGPRELEDPASGA